MAKRDLDNEVNEILFNDLPADDESLSSIFTILTMTKLILPNLIQFQTSVIH